MRAYENSIRASDSAQHPRLYSRLREEVGARVTHELALENSYTAERRITAILARAGALRCERCRCPIQGRWTDRVCAICLMELYEEA